MFAILSKLIPFRDWLYAAVLAGALIWYNVHVDRLEAAAVAHERAAVQTESNKVKTAALAKEAQDEAAYTASLKKVNDDQVKRAQVDRDAYAADLARLRQLAAGSSGGPALQGSTRPTALGGQVSDSASGLGFVPAGLGAELADALRTTKDQRDLCYAERDSLTGK